MNLLFSLCLLVITPQAIQDAEAGKFVTSSTGGIRGVVTEPNGAPSAGVIVRLKNLAGKSWYARTDAKGEYRAGLLPPGEYLITAERPGMSSLQYRKKVRQSAWLVLEPPIWIWPSSMSDGDWGLRPDKSHYEYPNGSGTTISREDLDKLPLR